jgi:hypothetical protein
MVRRSTPPAKTAARWFPVRIRIAVPPEGFGSQLDIMHRWLETTLGPEAYWMGGEAGAGRRDAILVYFMDVEGARAFVNRFACAVALLPNPTPGDRPR